MLAQWGVAAGCADDKGCFPDDSINAKVVTRLRTIAELDVLGGDEPKAPSA